MNGQYPHEYDQPWHMTPDDPRINDIKTKPVNFEEVVF